MTRKAAWEQNKREENTKKGRKVVKEMGEEEEKRVRGWQKCRDTVCVVLAPAQWTGNEILTVRFKC